MCRVKSWNSSELCEDTAVCRYFLARRSSPLLHSPAIQAASLAWGWTRPSPEAAVWDWSQGRLPWSSPGAALVGSIALCLWQLSTSYILARPFQSLQSLSSCRHSVFGDWCSFPYGWPSIFLQAPLVVFVLIWALNLWGNLPPLLRASWLLSVWMVHPTNLPLWQLSFGHKLYQ